MLSVTTSGRKQRSFHRHVSENIEYSRTPNMPLFTTVTDNKTMSEITKVCCNLLMVVI